MIERPPGGLPPREGRALRRAGLTVALGSAIGVVAGIVMASADVSEGIVTTVVLAIAVGTVCASAFWMLKMHHRSGVDLRRERKMQTRSTRLKQGIPMLILTGLMSLSAWMQGNDPLAAVIAVILSLATIWTVFDVWRAPWG